MGRTVGTPMPISSGVAGRESGEAWRQPGGVVRVCGGGEDVGGPVFVGERWSWWNKGRKEENRKINALIKRLMLIFFPFE